MQRRPREQRVDVDTPAQRTDAASGDRLVAPPLRQDRTDVAHGRDALLLSVLASAYGSTLLAQIALDAALARAGVERLPRSAFELACFLDDHLHATTEGDLGGVIASALRAELLQLVDAAERPEPAPPSVPRPLGHVSVRSTMRASPRQPAPAVEPSTELGSLACTACIDERGQPTGDRLVQLASGTWVRRLCESCRGTKKIGLTNRAQSL
jgi:hypothetical protein